MIINGEPKQIAEAYVKARGAMNATVTKDGKGNYGKYSTLAALVKATAAVFAEHGLAIIQEPHTSAEGVTMEISLMHNSGAIIQFAPLTLPLAQRTPQSVGSAITYARRYQLEAVCGLASEDDDGQAAEDAARTMPRQPAPRIPTSALKAEANPFEANPRMPTDEEHEVLATWIDMPTIYTWAIDNKACSNEFEARNSFKGVVEREFDGKFTKANAAAVYLSVLRHWNNKRKQAA